MGSAVRFRAASLIDQTGAFEGKPADVLIKNGRILSVLSPEPGIASEEDLFEVRRGTVLPGLIDVHAHFTFGTGSRSYEAVMAEDSDSVMVSRGQINLTSHLAAGVTTARDCGARGRTAMELKALVSRGGFPSPRLLVCGAPLTTPGGHFWFCGGEADGEEAVERKARELVAAGADFLKVMASGGGTVGTDQSAASFTVEEMAVAVRVARSVGCLTAAHCLSADSVDRALRAGIDQLEHINFIQPDGSRRMDSEIADRIVAGGVYVSPTIQTGYRRLEELRALPAPDPSQIKELAALNYKLETKLSFVSRLHELGARIVMGTDAIPSMGDYGLGLELLVRAGMSTRDAIGAATNIAATAIGLGDEVGTLSPGKRADLVVVDGDPLRDITSISRVLLVMRDGRVLHQDPQSAVLPT